MSVSVSVCAFDNKWLSGSHGLQVACDNKGLFSFLFLIITFQIMNILHEFTEQF